MRCIVVGAPMESEDILYDIGEYFWNAGKEVYISNNDFTNQNIQEERGMINKIVLIVLVQTGYNAHERLTFSNYFKTYFHHSFVQKVGEFIDHLEILNPSIQVNLPNYNDVPVILFCNKGVYSSEIPYPNKLYHCSSMNKQNFDDFVQKINHLKAFF